jgi:Glycosyltransferase family 87
VAAGAAYVQGYYYAKPYPFSTFLFNPSDKFVPGAPGVGTHYFGDLYGLWRHTRDANPYRHPSIPYPSNYLPFTHVLFKPLSWLSYPIASAGFLIGSLLATMAICWRWIEAQERVVHALLTLIIACLSYPVLFALDRGNVDILGFILLWLMIEAISRGAWTAAAVLLALGASMKGVPGILILLFVPARQWRAALLAIGLTVALSVVGLAIMHGGIVDNFNGLRDAIQSFNRTVDQGTTGLQHDSSIHGLLAVLEHWGLGGATGAAAALSAVLVVVAVLGSLLLPLALWERLTVLTVAFILAPTVTFDYRLVFMLLPVGVVLSGRHTPEVPAYVIVLFGLLLIPKEWPLLWADVGLGTLVNPLLMLGLFGVALAGGVARRRQGRAAPDGTAIALPA